LQGEGADAATAMIAPRKGIGLMRTRRLLTAWLGVLAALALTAGSATALAIPGTLDQEQAVKSDYLLFASRYAMAQTFTAGSTGNLVAIGVYVGVAQVLGVVANDVTPGPGTNFGITVTGTSSDAPTDTSLTNHQYVAISSETDPNWYYFVLDPVVAIVSGTKYAIKINSVGPDRVGWFGDCEGSYTDGAGYGYFLDSGSPAWQLLGSLDGYETCLDDFAFRTYVSDTTPPPSVTVSSGPDSTSSALPLFFGALTLVVSAAFVLRRRVEMPGR
jgi:hypothetical protein